MPPPTFFTTDDYTVLDVSGKAYSDEFFSFPGTFLQYLSDSSGSITVALGSGGSGPPKEITLSPGGKIELTDKSKPFSGFFLTCNANSPAKILVANSGIEVTPSPGRITQIGEVGRIINPIALDRPVGNAGLVLPVDVASLTDDDGNLRAGRMIRIENTRLPKDTVGWENVPVNDQVLDATRMPLNSMSFVVPLSAAVETASRLFPAKAGDVIFLKHAAMLSGPWYYNPSGGSTPTSRVLPPVGLAAGVRIGNSDTKIGLAEMQNLGLPDQSSRSGAQNAGPPNFGTFARIVGNANGENNACALATVRNHIITLTAAVASLVFSFPFPNFSSGNMKFKRGTNLGSGAWVVKPGITYSVEAILLKKGIDF